MLRERERERERAREREGGRERETYFKVRKDIEIKFQRYVTDFSQIKVHKHHYDLGRTYVRITGYFHGFITCILLPDVC